MRRGAQRNWAVLAVLAAVATFATPSVGLADTFTNPVLKSGADPFATQWGGQYFFTSTTGSNVRVARSPWLPSLNSNSRVVWDPPAGQPYSSNIWAPELHRLNDKWYMYVAADDGVDANHRMYVLEADSQDPQASYTLKGQITLPAHANRWAIDGTVLEHGGKDYFIWSGRTGSRTVNGQVVDSGSTQGLFIAEMSNPWTLTGTRTLLSSPQYTWERQGHGVNEGPQVLKDGDDVYLTYSASGFYTPNYAIGALKLTGSNPLQQSAWTKRSQPLFDQGNGVTGTGHASFVKSPDGSENWIVYHGRMTPDAGRDVRIQPFTFAGGWPSFGEPVASGQPVNAPAGVPLVTFVPNLSFERGGTGWLDDFRAAGDVGAVDNTGESFTRIAGGDGPRVGYVGASRGATSGLSQDVGPAHEGTYTLSVGLAISDDQAAVAAANPASFVLQLECVGLHPGGSANDADRTIIGHLVIASVDLAVSSFTRFEVSGIVSEADLVGSWLRVGLYAPGELAQGATPWQAKVDLMTLAFAGPDAASVPEPAGAAAMLGTAAAWFGRRANRRGRTNKGKT